MYVYCNIAASIINLSLPPPHTKTQTPDTKEELQVRLKALRKKFVYVRQLIHSSSHRMRQFPLGQDRYARQYWALPSVGGIIVEGVETSLDKNLQVLDTVVSHDVKQLCTDSQDESVVSEIDVVNLENRIPEVNQLINDNPSPITMETDPSQEVKVTTEENKMPDIPNRNKDINISMEQEQCVEAQLPPSQTLLAAQSQDTVTHNLLVARPLDTELLVARPSDTELLVARPSDTELLVARPSRPALVEEAGACTDHHNAVVLTQHSQESSPSQREENDGIIPMDHTPAQHFANTVETSHSALPSSSSQQPVPTRPQMEHHSEYINMSRPSVTRISMEQSPTPESALSQSPNKFTLNTPPLQSEHFTPTTERSLSPPKNTEIVVAPQSRAEVAPPSESLACSELLVGEESKDGMEDQQVTHEVRPC